MQEYFPYLQKKLEEAYAIAKEARSKNMDPEPEPEIIPTSDIATRVEGLVGPKGIADGIRALGLDRPHEIIAFEIAKEILVGKYGKGDKEKLIDQAVRTGVAILTEGVLVAPTEGIASIRLKQNP
ncbi:DNA polymerase II large subunit, partial [Candidatus Micrarchaeota archaeon]|nr:DNA polymerase II large subunit [Candidatus Micrarchaeota archaeon]